MMRVIKSIKPLDEEARLARWLQLTTRSAAYDRLRSERRRRNRELSASRPASANVAQSDVDERLEWLRRELLALDPDAASLLMMRHRFNWTLQQIGRVMGLKSGAVDRRLRTITERVRVRAEEVFDE
jgi:RNA polymerase sigma factor (sigma-70 family)